MGGRSDLAADERLYRFLFPERPGADDSDAFAEFLGTVNYPYDDESANPVYRLFLR